MPQKHKPGIYPKYVKRAFDLVGACLLLLLCAPLFILVAIGCMCSFQGKVIFSQARAGKHEKTFMLYKFISMRPMRRDDDQADSQRLNAYGRFIRRNSLDELPQLWNIILGDMSLIGPRPLFVHYLPHYSEVERIRHSVRPGITGLAQIKGRNTLTWDERLKLDVEYVQHLSLKNDLRIALSTLGHLFHKQGVQDDPRSMQEDLDKIRSNG